MGNTVRRHNRRAAASKQAVPGWVRRMRWLFRLHGLGLLLIGLFMVATAAARDGEVLVLDLAGPIAPATADIWVDAIDEAERDQAEALVVKLDTPGGLDTSMRRIIKKMLASSVPVVIYVAPEGSRAASAGVFLLYASHVAAMAPGTNLGAAHPVMMGEGEVDETMMEKATNDSAAYIRSLAEMRGRNAEWGERAVRESVSLTADEAVADNVVDLVAVDMEELLGAIDGRTVQTATGPVTLATKGKLVREIDVSSGKRFLAALTDPNVAYILMMLGTYGLIYELANPGAILPGVVGAICLILALYAFSTLPVSYAGLALVMLAMVLFIAEAMVSGFGLLAGGGVVALVIGSVMLANTDVPFAQVSWQILVPVTLVTIAFAVITAMLAARSFRKRPVSGAEGMVGTVVKLAGPLEPEGQIELMGELWKARAPESVAAGERVRVTGFEGLVALVAPEHAADGGGEKTDE